MKILHQGDALLISGMKELDAANSDRFCNSIRAALPGSIRTIDIDLSQTGYVDISGLGALIAVHKAVADKNGAVSLRLLNPTPPVQQLLELTRIYRVFEIIKEEEPVTLAAK